MAKMHPPHPSAFRVKLVELVRTSGTGVPQLAHKLGISEEVLHDWLKRANGDARRVDDGGAGR